MTGKKLLRLPVMSRLNRRACLWFLVSIIVLIAGCAPKPPIITPPVVSNPEDPPPIVDTGRVKVLSPVHVSHFVVNPLKFVETREDDGRSYDMKVFISGLRDEEVQEIINEDLRLLYQDMKERELPAYRGIRVHIPDEGEKNIYSNSISANVTYNYNNVLSLMVSCHRNYLVNPYGATAHVSFVETRNYDLNTGQQISLDEVFVDDVDYRDLVNDLISKQLVGSSASEENYDWFDSGSPKLVSPFRGIGDDAVFHLFWMGVNIVLDHRTPEFDTSYHHRSLPLPFRDLQGKLAVTRRYFHEEEDAALYVDDKPPVKELMGHPFNAAMVNLSKEDKAGNVIVLASCRYPAGAHHRIVDFALEQYDSYGEKVNELRSQAGPDRVVIHRILTHQVGTFTTVMVDQSVYEVLMPIQHYVEMSQWGPGGEGYVESQYLLYCFDEEGNERDLASLFVEGFDHKSIIASSYKQNVKRYDHLAKNAPAVEGLWEGLQFQLNTTDITFRTPLVEVDGHFSPIVFSVLFSDFGCENMTIFGR
jgi:hypothetical protein